MDAIEEVKEEIIKKVDGYNTQLDEVTKKFDDLDAKTKAAVEDFQKARDSLEGTANDQATAMKKLNGMVANLQRNAFEMYGDPVERIARNEEKRCRLNAAVRLCMDKNGDLRKVAEPLMKALGEDSSPGSTIIDDEMLREIYDTLSMYGSWNTLGVRRMGTKTTKMPISTARPVANFILTEGGTISDDSNKAGTTVSLEAEVIAVLLKVSLQLLQDSEFDVTADVLNDFREAFNYRLDYAAFQGDGTADATHGGCTGLFNFGTAATAASGNTTMETLDFEDFTNVLLTPDETVLNRAARWWIHPHMLIRCLHIKDSNGRPIFLTANEAPTPGGIGTLLGYPVSLVNAAPNTNSAGNAVAAFGDPQGFVVGVRQDFGFEASDEFSWNTLQRTFRAYGRADAVGRRANAFGVLTLAGS